MAVSIVNFSKRLWVYYKPHFGFWQRLMGAGIIVINICNAILVVFIGSSMNAVFGILENQVTWPAFISASSSCFWYGGLYVLVSTIKSELFSRLSMSLSHSINEKILKKWILSKGYYGLRFVQNDEDKLDPSQIISRDNFSLIEESAGLIHALITAACMFSVGVYMLYSLSVPLTISLLGFTFTIPGYIAIGTLLYAWGYNIITNYIGRSLKETENNIRNAESNLTSKTSETINQAESIAFKNGTSYVFNMLKIAFAKIEKSTGIATSIKRRLELVTEIHYSFMTYLFPLMLAIPNIISKQMNTATFYQILQHFTSVVSLFTFKNEYLSTITTCEVSLSRVEQFNRLLKKWKKINKEISENRPSQKESDDPECYVFENIGALRPVKDEKQNKTFLQPMFEIKRLEIRKGLATQIGAPTGEGKTTFLRTLADLWPYVKSGGSVSLPKDIKMEFISQHGFIFHQGQTLLDVILYPNTTPLDLDIKSIEELMGEMNFKLETIKALKLHDKDWEKELSGGEKQRIILLSAILKKPEVLFLDEVTSEIDAATKIKVENILKRELPKCAIVFVDHNATESFGDVGYRLKKMAAA